MKLAKQKQKVTIVGLVTAIICWLMFTTAMTFAYFTARNSAESTAMQFGTLAVGINGYSAVSADSHTLVPGCTINLAGNIELAEIENDVIVNDSTIGAFVRIKLTIEPATSGDTLPDTTGLLSTITTAFGSNWLTSGSDGYLYYAGKFMPVGTTTLGTNEVTVFNLSSVNFKFNENTFGNDWQGKSFKLKIEAEAIQADHVGITPAQITTGGQDLVNAIAGAKQTNASESAWDSITGGPDYITNLSFTEITSIEENTTKGEVSVGGNLYTSGNVVVPSYVKNVGDGWLVASEEEYKSYEAYAVTTVANTVYVEDNLEFTNEEEEVLYQTAKKMIGVYSSSFNMGFDALYSKVLGDLTKYDGVFEKQDENSTYNSTSNPYIAYKHSTLSELKNSNEPSIDERTPYQQWIHGCETLAKALSILDEVPLEVPYCFMVKLNMVNPITMGIEANISSFRCNKTYLMLELPNTITTIQSSAFDNCMNLLSITIPESVTSIGDGAFNSCSNLVQVRNFSNQNIAEISNNVGLELKTDNSPFENEITVDDDYVFYNVGAKKYLIAIKNPLKSEITDLGNYNVTDICDNTFLFNSRLETIEIPSCVKSIGEKAFGYCLSLNSVTLQNGVESIGAHAFSLCTSITTITIPSSVTSIGGHAFYGCTNLTSVTFGIRSGWRVSSSSDMSDSYDFDSHNIDLSDTSTAAKCLTNTYKDKYWARSQN